jgi:hypothetical protein
MYQCIILFELNLSHEVSFRMLPIYLSIHPMRACCNHWGGGEIFLYVLHNQVSILLMGAMMPDVLLGRCARRYNRCIYKKNRHAGYMKCA